MFDGLGNHDYAKTHVLEDVTKRKRATVKTLKGVPHYSWDWHDVHFVQLNLMPADSAAPEFPELYPMGALSFLINDLATYVGDSQRPVILMHHYGFDVFSMGVGINTQVWWTAEQRLAYWNAIANYNVVAIFTGHLHPTPYQTNDTSRYIRWTRPVGASGGPASIPTFVSGAAREGAYLEVEFNNANQLSVSVRTSTETTATRCYAKSIPVWVDQASTAVSHGWKNAPYRSVSEAVSATATRWNCVTNVVTLRVKPGAYNEAIRITQPTRLEADGSGVAHIGP
jgi:hypothetical protein